MGDRKGSGYRVRTGDAGEKRATIGNRGGTGVTGDRGRAGNTSYGRDTSMGWGDK